MKYVIRIGELKLTIEAARQAAPPPDTFGGWYRECVVSGLQPAVKIWLPDLIADYRRWCFVRAIPDRHVLGSKAFYNRLAGADVQIRKIGGGRYCVGAALKQALTPPTGGSSVMAARGAAS